MLKANACYSCHSPMNGADICPDCFKPVAYLEAESDLLPLTFFYRYGLKWGEFLNQVALGETLIAQSIDAEKLRMGAPFSFGNVFNTYEQMLAVVHREALALLPEKARISLTTDSVDMDKEEFKKRSAEGLKFLREQVFQPLNQILLGALRDLDFLRQEFQLLRPYLFLSARVSRQFEREHFENVMRAVMSASVMHELKTHREPEMRRWAAEPGHLQNLKQYAWNPTVLQLAKHLSAFEPPTDMRGVMAWLKTFQTRPDELDFHWDIRANSDAGSLEQVVQLVSWRTYAFDSARTDKKTAVRASVPLKALALTLRQALKSAPEVEPWYLIAAKDSRLPLTPEELAKLGQLARGENPDLAVSAMLSLGTIKEPKLVELVANNERFASLRWLIAPDTERVRIPLIEEDDMPEEYLEDVLRQFKDFRYAIETYKTPKFADRVYNDLERHFAQDPSALEQMQGVESSRTRETVRIHARSLMLYLHPRPEVLIPSLPGFAPYAEELCLIWHKPDLNLTQNLAEAVAARGPEVFERYITFAFHAKYEQFLKTLQLESGFLHAVENYDRAKKLPYLFQSRILWMSLSRAAAAVKRPEILDPLWKQIFTTEIKIEDLMMALEELNKAGYIPATPGILSDAQTWLPAFGRAFTQWERLGNRSWDQLKAVLSAPHFITSLPPGTGKALAAALIDVLNGFPEYRDPEFVDAAKSFVLNAK